MEPGMSEQRTSQQPNLSEWMGAQLIEAREGRAIVRMPVHLRHCHSGEDPRVAGGVVMSLMDFAIHHALASLLAPGEVHATVEMKLNFIRPGQLGTLRAEASIVNKGRRFAVAEGAIVQEDTGQIVAKALTTETVVEMARRS
jgi:uncharacterized protein (TIGR00369 family)